VKHLVIANAGGVAPVAFSGIYRSTDSIYRAATSSPILGTGPGLDACADRFPAFFNTLGRYLNQFPTSPATV
jgi:hypothetical protein